MREEERKGGGGGGGGGGREGRGGRYGIRRKRQSIFTRRATYQWHGIDEPEQVLLELRHITTNNSPAREDIFS